MTTRHKRMAIACLLAMKIAEASRKASKRSQDCLNSSFTDSEHEETNGFQKDCADLQEFYSEPAEDSYRKFISEPVEDSILVTSDDCGLMPASGGNGQAAGSREPPVKRRIWTKVYLSKQDFLDIEERLLIDLVSGSLEGEYKNICRMTADRFYHMLEQVEAHIAKKDTTMRFALPAKLRLVVTLKFIFHGETFVSLNKSTGISSATLSKMIPDVLNAIIKYIGPECIKTPQTTDEWLEISKSFSTRYEFPHVLGALEGQFIKTSSGKKSENDVAIIAAIDSDYRIIYHEVIGTGTIPEHEINQKSVFMKALRTGELNLPQPACLDGDLDPIPYYFVANNSFCLNDNIMIPYDEQHNTMFADTFNQKIDRTAAVAETWLSIMANRFRILGRTITILPDNLCHILKTICILYNYLLNASEIPVFDGLFSELPDTFRNLNLSLIDEKSALYFREKVAVNLFQN